MHTTDKPYSSFTRRKMFVDIGIMPFRAKSIDPKHKGNWVYGTIFPNLQHGGFDFIVDIHDETIIETDYDEDGYGEDWERDETYVNVHNVDWKTLQTFRNHQWVDFPEIELMRNTMADALEMGDEVY